MLSNISFGQYYPTDSVVHHLDARAKILFALAYIVIIFFIKSFICYIFAFLCVFLVAAVARIPIRALLRSIKMIIFLAIFTFVLNILFVDGEVILLQFWKITIYKEGIVFAVKMAARLVLLVLGSSLLTFTTTPMELTDAIEMLMSPLKVIKFPVHDFALMMSIALRMIPTLMEETDKIIMAQKSRGANLDTGNIFQRAKAMIPILIPLFVGAFRRADELALALDSRCYNATPKRTKLRQLRLSGKDAVATLFILLFMAAIIVDCVLLEGIDSEIIYLIFGVRI